MPSNPEIRVLLLAGGKSQRMGKDKAALFYDGKSQLDRMIELVTPLEMEVYLSVREDQSHSGIPGVKALYDNEKYAGVGPMGGMLSALSKFPDSAFLVIACDLPFLNLETLQFLLQQRETAQFATAFASNHDGLPEPLCAIWEPESKEILEEKLRADIRCPRKILIQGNLNLLKLPKPDALDNINTPEEYEAAVKKLSSTE